MLLFYLSTAQRIQGQMSPVHWRNLQTATNCWHLSGKWRRTQRSTFKPMFCCIWRSFLRNMMHLLPVFFCSSLQICGQVQHCDRASDSVVKQEPGWSKQAEEQNKEVEDWANTRSGSTSMDSTSMGWRLLQLPSMPGSMPRVLPTLEIWRWKDWKANGSSIWSRKQSFEGLAAHRDRSPTARTMLGGDVSWTLFELLWPQMPRKDPLKPMTQWCPAFRWNHIKKVYNDLSAADASVFGFYGQITHLNGQF